MDGTLGNIIFTICTMIFILTSVVLVLVILVQKPQGGGLSAAFGGGGASSQSAFGAKTGDMLTIGTVCVFVIFLAISITLVLMTAGRYDRAGASLPPDQPTNLLVEATSSSTVHLTWKDESKNEDQFTIERSATKDGPWVSVGSVDKDEEQFTDTKAQPKTKYYYRVSAVNANGTSNSTDVVSTTTPETKKIPDEAKSGNGAASGQKKTGEDNAGGNKGGVDKSGTVKSEEGNAGGGKADDGTTGDSEETPAPAKKEDGGSGDGTESGSDNGQGG